jgi:hypothetical protein
MENDADSAILALVHTFYGAFDNRGSRLVRAEALYALFATAATITRIAPDQVERLGLAEFIEPRVQLLHSGSLVGFHEWEVEGETVILGDIASRWSVYRKEGTLHGKPYLGAGHKLLQFYRQEGRWLISALLWQDEQNNQPWLAP